MTLTPHFRTAIQNIATHGDTDVMPFPIENRVFYDREEETLRILERFRADFNAVPENKSLAAAQYAPKDRVDTDNSLIAVGYTGFRLGTQIDPIWNAYLLGLVVSIGEEIERRRLPPQEARVFSYRFKHDPDKNTLFDREIGWREFQQASIKRAQKATWVVVSDISDFYPRIYHHRLENALGEATADRNTVAQIMFLLKKITKHNVSYGLPVGGPAARLLSELLLNRVDHLLTLKGVDFCRFADDYHIFAPTREAAYSSLVLLSELLYDNEGLSLQKSKTRMMKPQEFEELSDFAPRKPHDTDEAKARSLLGLKLRFDPYSPTAKQDYEKLKATVKDLELNRWLNEEMRKSRLHPALTRRVLSALPFEDPEVISVAVRLLVDNLKTPEDAIPRLYPVIPSVMILLKSVINVIDPDVRTYTFETLRNLITNDSLELQLPANLCYALRILADDPSPQTDALLDRVRQKGSLAIKRDVILIMARRGARFWLSNLKGNFNWLAAWERRAMIIASQVMGDEGEHWRGNVRHAMSPLDDLVARWAKDRFQEANWRIPV